MNKTKISSMGIVNGVELLYCDGSIYAVPICRPTRRVSDGVCRCSKPRPNARKFMGVKLCLACGKPRKQRKTLED